MQIGSAALVCCAWAEGWGGGGGDKVHCGAFLFSISKGKRKTFPRILFITPGINSAYYNQL